MICIKSKGKSEINDEKINCRVNYTENTVFVRAEGSATFVNELCG